VTHAFSPCRDAACLIALVVLHRICARLDESFVRAAVGHDSILSFAHSVARGQAGQYCNDGSMALADALVAALA